MVFAVAILLNMMDYFGIGTRISVPSRLNAIAPMLVVYTQMQYIRMAGRYGSLKLFNIKPVTLVIKTLSHHCMAAQ